MFSDNLLGKSPNSNSSRQWRRAQASPEPARCQLPLAQIHGHGIILGAFSEEAALWESCMWSIMNIPKVPIIGVYIFSLKIISFIIGDWVLESRNQEVKPHLGALLNIGKNPSLCPAVLFPLLQAILSCAPQSLPEGPQQEWASAAHRGNVTIYPLLVFLPSLVALPNSRPVLPGINFSVNYLHLNLCLRVCFWGDQTKTALHPYSLLHLFIAVGEFPKNSLLMRSI